jgi:Major tropism determinant N-terminal domain
VAEHNMANKIQLRRDTTANWNNVNPILADGEPGLDITTNQVKYGDGANAWANLSYASGGSASTGDWTFTGSVANIASYGNSKIDGNGIGGLMLINDNTISINSIGSNWLFQSNGNLQLPNNSTISALRAGETVTLDQLTDISSWAGTLVFTKQNDTTYQALPDGPIMRYIGSNWLIQYDATSWFSSADLETWVTGPYAGTTAPVGTVSLVTTNLTVGDNTWKFSADGMLKLPGNLWVGTWKDGDSVLWASDTSEYVGLWYGGERANVPGYGPNVSITVGNESIDDNLSGGWDDGLQINLDIGDKNWHFDAAGDITLPLAGNIHFGYGNAYIQSVMGFHIGSEDPVDINVNGSSWYFGSNGILTLPTTYGPGAGDEGAEIDFTKAPNSTLSGSTVVVDQYIDRLRFFESGGTNRGAYIDLKQAAAGVGTLLNNRVSAFVNAGTFVTMDNIKATVTTSSNRGLSLATVSGTATCFISGTYGMFGGATVGGSSAGVELTTTPSVSMFSWSFGSEGDTATYILNYGYTKSYRITMMIGASYNNNMISIERLV